MWELVFIDRGSLMPKLSERMKWLYETRILSLVLLYNLWMAHADINYESHDCRNFPDMPAVKKVEKVFY